MFYLYTFITIVSFIGSISSSFTQKREITITAIPTSITKNETTIKESNITSTTATTSAISSNSFPRYFDVYGKNKELVMQSITASLYGADEQCKILFGKEARFCRQYGKVMCKTLYCRRNSNGSCEAATVGALEGTTCESGKLCVKSFCTDSPKAPLGDCLFGDDVVSEESIGMKLSSKQMTCSSVLGYIMSINQTATAYCSNSNFRQLCCQTCKKYEILTCTDKYFDCLRYKNVCEAGSINGLPVSILCQRTCKKCVVKPVYCEGSSFICENGGTCKNVSADADSLFGFSCDCQKGYFGELCEYRNSCLPNPCAPYQRCEALGNVAYKCVDLENPNLPTTTRFNGQAKVEQVGTEQEAAIRPLGQPNDENSKNYYFTNNRPNKPIACVDFDSSICSYYASQGLCKNFYYLRGTEITIQCPKSCQRC